MIKKLFLKGGWFTPLGSFSCFLTGLTTIGLVLWLEPHRFISLMSLVNGAIFIGLAGYEARARALGLEPPFTRDPLGWRKAKESYNTPTDSKSAKDAESD